MTHEETHSRTSAPPAINVAMKPASVTWRDEIERRIQAEQCWKCGSDEWGLLNGLAVVCATCGEPEDPPARLGPALDIARAVLT